MTAIEYWNDFAEKNDYWNPDKLCQAYIIVLGANDLYWRKMELGSVADINREASEKNAETFCGYYARIIQRLKSMQPKAKFFLVTMPRNLCPGDAENVRRHAALLNELAEFFTLTQM